jgi:hypothetical protein
MFYRLTPNAGLHNDGMNSPVSKRPLNPSWSNYTTTSPRFRQSAP